MSRLIRSTNLTKLNDEAELDKPRAALVVYRYILDEPHFLLVSTRGDKQRLTLPGGKVGRKESAAQAAERETVEESGIKIEDAQELGAYIHRKRCGRLHPTDTFLAPFAGYQPDHEPRRLHWLTLEDLSNGGYRVRRSIRKQIERAAEALRIEAEQA